MPFFQLSLEDIGFPPAYFADPEGLIAVGGDLSPERVLEALENGIYFWYGPMDPIKWWSPDPRLLLLPDEVRSNPILKINWKISPAQEIIPTLQRLQKQENHGEMGPHWVTEEMISMYSSLFERGLCKVLEVSVDHKSIGTVIGFALGTSFVFEYILLNEENTYDECALVAADFLFINGYDLIDIQKETIRISDIGITEISRLEYLDIHKKAHSQPPPIIDWSKIYTTHGKLQKPI